MAIRHYSEIEWYDSNGNLVKVGLVNKDPDKGVYDNRIYKDSNVKVEVGSLLLGQDNECGGQYSIIVGQNNTNGIMAQDIINCANNIIGGNNNKSTNANQIVVGQWNNTSQSGYLIVGTGNNSLEQKNRSGFRVEAKDNGDAKVHVEGDILLHSGASESGAKIYYQNNAIIFDFVS